MELAKIFINYPELFCLNEAATSWTGYITISKSSTYQVTLHVPKFPSSESLTYSIPSITNPKILQEIDQIKSSRMLDYLKQLTNILSHHDNKYNVSNHDFDLIHAYQFLKRNPNVVSLEASPNLTKFQFKFNDSAQRLHDLTIVFTNLNRYKIEEHYLPEDFEENLNFTDLFDSYSKVIEGLQNYFNVMDSIDDVCWVIDPVKPTRRDCSRRIVIGHNVSIQVKFDPKNITRIPTIQFMGSEAAVTPFRDSYISNIENWDPDYDILQNILRLLDLPFFPMAPSVNENRNELDFESNECCICFCVRLNNELPDQVCKNNKCEQHFHVECLYQWLSAVGSFHPNFQLAQGECPNCKTTITCPIPKT